MAKTENAPTSSESEVPVRPAIQLDETVRFPAAPQSAARELSSELGFMEMGCIGKTDLELAPIAFLNGYLARACEEKECTLFLQDSIRHLHLALIHRGHANDCDFVHSYHCQLTDSLFNCRYSLNAHALFSTFVGS